MRSGTPGVPFPRDIELKECSEAALGDLSRFSAGYDLYEKLLRYAEGKIEEARRYGETLDDC
jgi:hypothetical protein